MFKVLLATDGSEYSEKAARYVGQLCEKMEDCEIHVLYVKDISALTLASSGEAYYDYTPNTKLIQDELDALGDSALAAAQKILERTGKRVILHTTWGRPSDMICRIAEDDKFDLVVMGRRGRGQIADVLLGSVSDRVSHCAQVPVMIVHEEAAKAQ